jgi:hypothetical protein
MSPLLTQSGQLAQRKIKRVSKKNQTFLQACCRSGGYQLPVRTTLGIVSPVRTAANCTGTLIEWALPVAKTETIMPTHIGGGQKSSHWHGTERTNDAESIGTLWFIFYMLALGAAISSPLISRAIKFAALTDQ